MKNLKGLVNNIAVDMVWYREANREHEASFVESTIKKVLKEVYKDKDLSIHADYISEKIRTWKNCDIGSLKRIVQLTV